MILRCPSVRGLADLPDTIMSKLESKSSVWGS
jgi:hypothetical protein